MNEKAIYIIMSIVDAMFSAYFVQKAIYAKGFAQLVYIALAIFYASFCVTMLNNPAGQK